MGEDSSASAGRRIKGTLNRQGVLEAAVALFNRLGYDRTSMNDIAAALGITKPALYHYFPSKEKIFTASIERASEIVGSALDEGTPQDGPAMDRVEAFVKAYAQALADPVFRSLVLADERVLDAEGKAAIRACKRGSQLRLESLLREAGGEAVDARAVARIIFGALNWSAVALGDSFGDSLDALLASITHLTRQGLATPQANPTSPPKKEIK